MNTSLTRCNSHEKSVSTAEIGDAFVTLRKTIETIVDIIESSDPNTPASPESVAKIAAAYADNWANTCYKLAD